MNKEKAGCGDLSATECKIQDMWLAAYHIHGIRLSNRAEKFYITVNEANVQ